MGRDVGGRSGMRKEEKEDERKKKSISLTFQSLDQIPIGPKISNRPKSVVWAH